MTFNEKMELVRLLNKYQDDCLKLQIENIKNLEKYDNCSWKVPDYHYGIKSQYNHARIINAKLSNELSKEIKV